MRDDTTGLVLAAGGVAGAYYLTRELLRSDQERVEAEAALAVTPAVIRQTERTTALASRRFDPLFAEHGQGLPVPYLRALAMRESSMNPAQSKGPAWGLLQVIEVVRTDYNKRHGTAHTRADLLDPVINIQIAADLLRRIVAGYGRFHPRVPNLQEDWNNARLVELVTFGWNAGYSEKAGAGRVARFLEERGIVDITIDTIHENAAAAGASRHLRRADKVRWCKGVAALYFRERTRDEREAADKDLLAYRNGSLTYRPVGGRPGDPYPEWLRALKGQSGAYVIRERDRHGEPVVVYVGESHSGRLYDTLTRHLQDWRRYKGFWSGQYGKGHDPGLTYDRERVEVAVRITHPDDAIDEEARLIRRLRPRDNLLGQPEPEEVPF